MANRTVESEQLGREQLDEDLRRVDQLARTSVGQLLRLRFAEWELPQDETHFDVDGVTRKDLGKELDDRLKDVILENNPEGRLKVVTHTRDFNFVQIYNPATGIEVTVDDYTGTRKALFANGSFVSIFAPTHTSFRDASRKAFAFVEELKTNKAGIVEDFKNAKALIAIAQNLVGNRLSSRAPSTV